MKPGAAPLLAGVGGGVAAVLASFLPWMRTGRVVRSGFELATAAWGAGLAGVRLGEAMIVLWLLSPVAVAAAWTSASLGRPRPAGALVAAAGAVVVGAGVVVLRSSSDVLFGPYAGIFAGAAGFGGGLWLMFARRSADE